MSAPEPAPRLGWPIRVALAATLVLLLGHAWIYRFLTDDAFISFRYARNFAGGFGLVFNPGGERVEGYSNLLWVLILGVLDRFGIAPERAANPLSLLATAALWWVVVRFTLERRRAGEPGWWLLVPPGLLALSRSFAVWSTGGLETRLFELLATAGILRVVAETEALRERRGAGTPWGAILLGLAALTRPDGALIAGCAIAAGAVRTWMAIGLTRESVSAWMARGWPAAAMIVAHTIFRLAYYGAWAPNTYYAKVGGRLKPEAGLEYLATFVLEYAAFLWLPALFAAVAARRRAGWLAIAAIALLPHVAYVIAIGGDHFEYRPLDVIFPCLGLLLYEGLRAARESPWRRRLVQATLALSIVGTLYLPWRSHAEFPRVYMPGFPGLQLSPGPVAVAEAADADHFLDPGRSFLTRLPLFRFWAEAHRRGIRRLTSYYSGIRQEEHRLFFESIHAEGVELRGLIDRGLLPADIAMAMDCVGAIPYLTNARTLDRLGLTDARVAHQPFSGELVAHGKSASFDYARERGVDLWFFHPAQLTAPAASSRAMRSFVPAGEREPGVYVAPLDSSRWLMARFPLGESAARARMPRLRFWDMRDSADVRAARDAAVRAWEARLDSVPRDTEALDAIGFLNAEARRWAEAAASYRRLAGVAERDPDPLINLAACLDQLGDAPGALLALRQAAERAGAAGDEATFRELSAEVGRREAARPEPPRRP